MVTLTNVNYATAVNLELSYQGRIHGLKSGGRIMASARNEALKAPRG